MAHTLGPWTVSSGDVWAQGLLIAGIPGDLSGALDNARLIAAAPEMLEALQALVAQILDYENVNNLSPNPGRKYCWDDTERAVAAIAKATGNP